MCACERMCVCVCVMCWRLCTGWGLRCCIGVCMYACERMCVCAFEYGCTYTHTYSHTPFHTYISTYYGIEHPSPTQALHILNIEHTHTHTYIHTCPGTAGSSTPLPHKPCTLLKSKEAYRGLYACLHHVTVANAHSTTLWRCLKRFIYQRKDSVPVCCRYVCVICMVGRFDQ